VSKKLEPGISVVTISGRITRTKRWLARQLATHLSKNWDLKHRVDTAGRIPLTSLGENAGGPAQWAYDVVSAPVSVFSHIARFFPSHREECTYVDIGAGKGRTVMLASEMGFKRCVGVEFAAFAAKIAQKNLQSYVGKFSSRSPCSIVETCATKFRFPEGDLVLFFNNPFSEEIWKQVVQRLCDISNVNRTITVVLIGSFPETIRNAADLLVQSSAFVRRAEGITPRFWDSYARFHFFVLDRNQQEKDVAAG
jgi:predicted RNA methylase